MRRVLLLLVLSVFSLQAYTQEKMEKEESISISEVPKPALEFISSCDFSRRVRWYQETSLDGTSVEAKVKFQKHLYSIEFSNIGELEDIEKKVKFKAINSLVRNQISQSMLARFGKFKVLKTQLQWVQGASEMQSFFLGQNSAPPIEAFEIEIEGITQGDIKLYEITCDTDGNISNVRSYVPRPTDNLDF